MKVAIYIRYSSENQRDGYSIEYQLEECQRFIERNNYNFIKAYIDEAVSGKSVNNRTAFFELLQDVKKGLYDIVLVYKYSRFARNLMEARLYHHQIEKAGARLISAKEQIDDTTPEGRMMRNIIMSMDEYYSDNLSTFVQSSMYTAAKQGRYLGGELPFGFALDENKNYIENKKEADIVRRIFELRKNGIMPADTIKLFNSEGITSRNNKPFTQQLISKILRAKKYIGVYSYKIKGYEPIEIEGAMPQIVDLQTWRAVQISLNESASKKNTKGRARRYSYALTGKIVCGLCGEPFTGTSKGSKSNLKYYCCRGRDKLAKCDNHAIKKEELEDYTFNHIKLLMLNDNVINDIANQIFNKIEAPTPQNDLKELKKEQSKINKQIESLVDLLLDGSISKEILNKKTKDLQERLNVLNAQIEQEEFKQNSVVSLQDIKDFLQDTLKSLENADDLTKRAIAEQFIESIIINRYDVKIRLTANPSFLGFKGNDGWALFTLSPKRIKNRSGYSLIEKTTH